MLICSEQKALHDCATQLYLNALNLYGCTFPLSSAGQFGVFLLIFTPLSVKQRVKSSALVSMQQEKEFTLLTAFTLLVFVMSTELMCSFKLTALQIFTLES